MPKYAPQIPYLVYLAVFGLKAYGQPDRKYPLFLLRLALRMMSNKLLTCNHAKELFLFHELREWDELKMIMVENITLGEFFLAYDSLENQL